MTRFNLVLPKNYNSIAENFYQSKCGLFGIECQKQCKNFCIPFFQTQKNKACQAMKCKWFLGQKPNLKKIKQSETLDMMIDDMQKKLIVMKYQTRLIKRIKKLGVFDENKARTNIILADSHFKKINAIISINIARNKALFFLEGLDMLQEIAETYFEYLEKYQIKAVGVSEFANIMADVNSRMSYLNKLFGTSKIPISSYIKHINPLTNKSEFTLDSNGKKIKAFNIKLFSVSQLKKELKNVVKYGTVEVDVSYIMECFKAENSQG